MFVVNLSKITWIRLIWVFNTNSNVKLTRKDQDMSYFRDFMVDE